MRIVTESEKNTIIIGGGIAGCVLALALHKIGIKSEIFEAKTIPEDNVGLFHYISPNGMNVYRELGLYEKIKHLGYLCNGVIHYNEKQKIIGRIDERNSESDYGANSIMIKREFLTKTLRDEVLLKNIPIHFGKKIENLKDIGKIPVTACFEDGTCAKGDFVVGCDGIYSKTRQIILPSSPKPTYTKVVVTGGFSKIKLKDQSTNTIHSNYGKNAFLAYFILPNKKDVWWWNGISYPTEETREGLAKLSDEKWHQNMIGMYAEDSDEIQSVINSKEIEFLKYPVSDMPPLNKWYKENVCLIGDAVHATSPTNGQGAAMACEDALMLAKCLRDIQNTNQAFEKFQKLRQKRVEKIVKIGRSGGEGYLFTNPFKKWLRNTMISFFLTPFIFNRMKNFFYGYNVEWEKKVK